MSSAHCARATTSATTLRTAAFVVGVAASAMSGGWACSDPRVEPVTGIRLGMTAAEVRAALGDRGTLRVATDGALEFESSSAEDTLRRGRFEIHGGLLVAVRAVVAAPATADLGIASDAISVVERTRAGEGLLAVRWIARDCPVHRAEVESMLTRR